MKTYRLLAILAIAWCCGVTLAEDLTPEQRQFRQSIVQFLREEGFSPSINYDDNSVEFKKEGRLYWININRKKPFFVQLRRVGISEDEAKDANRTLLLEATNYATTSVYFAKAVVDEHTNAVYMSVEFGIHSQEEFNYLFYSYLGSIDLLYDRVYDYYNEHISTYSTGSSRTSVASTPFTFNYASVGNEDINHNLIHGYGSTIYSSRTRYLKPKIYLNVKTAGKYTIQVKLFTPSGEMSQGSTSPTGYTYTTDITVYTGSNNGYELEGWGKNTDGNWKAGKYRFEFYHNGKYLGTHHFTIY